MTLIASSNEVFFIFFFLIPSCDFTWPIYLSNNLSNISMQVHAYYHSFLFHLSISNISAECAENVNILRQWSNYKNSVVLHSLFLSFLEQDVLSYVSLVISVTGVKPRVTAAWVPPAVVHYREWFVNRVPFTLRSFP